MYDIIGDIHGHAAELTTLLDELGYRRRDGVYVQPKWRAIFVGDFIDRGPQIARALSVVRAMVEAGAALAVMGNHEFNALAFHTADPGRPGEFLRSHREKNVHQHRATLEQLEQTQLAEALAWFRTLPLWLDLDGVRVVHACWDDEFLAAIEAALPAGAAVSDHFLQRASDRGDPLFAAVDATLKGKEIRLPTGGQFADKDGNQRNAIRAKWHLPPDGRTFRTYALQSDAVECDQPLTEAAFRAARPYPFDAKPVFVGHYWLFAATPTILATNVACVDYSVAKRGMLCAYRWDGEQQLDDRKFVAVDAR